MTRRKKPKLSKTERQHRRKQRDDNELDELVDEMTGHFTCSYELAKDFAVQCEERQSGLDYDVAAARLAREFWSGQPGPRAQQVLALLAEFEAAAQRHFDLLADLSRRFDACADDHGHEDHEHLEPVDAYRERLRQRLFPDPAPSDPPAG